MIDRETTAGHGFQGTFSYELAFDRNIGWITEWEQQALRGKRVAIAGLGGVGGLHVISLARLGVGALHVADLDQFELANFNRQFGATLATLGRPKAKAVEEIALSINPELLIRRFDVGVTPQNLEQFLEGVDLFVDGLDFFVLDIRRKIFARCDELGIPAVTAAPIGMGAGFLAFVPGGMSFEQYFRLEGLPQNDQYVRFLMGVAPRGLHRPYLVDPSRVDLRGRRGPSTVAACELCAAITAVAAIKLLLRRGDLKPAPYHHHFDAYRGKLVVTHLRHGNAGLLQRAKLAIAQRIYDKMSKKATPVIASTAPNLPLMAILNIARWAPSGDNRQPWRFRIQGADAFSVLLDDHSDRDVYEYRGAEPSILAAGMLLESIRIAASAFGRTMEWHYAGREDMRYRIDVGFTPAAGLEPDPLYSWVPMRSVDRRRYRLRPLTVAQKADLEQSLGNELRVVWHEDLNSRWQLARLSAKATNIRLRIPEAFQVHRRAIDWDHALSTNGIPAKAVGLDPLTLKVMRWAMGDWSRMQSVNRLLGTIGAQVQLDLLPGIASGAFFTIHLTGALPDSEERIGFLLRSGERLQRFWLTATRLGLALQPECAVLAFAHYGHRSISFTKEPNMLKRATALARDFQAKFQKQPEEILFIGRIGTPRSATIRNRSVRRPLTDLIETDLSAGSSKSVRGNGEKDLVASVIS
jgi:sulfur-carrier protein adenylyltransferase/sulfurtransferase